MRIPIVTNSAALAAVVPLCSASLTRAVHRQPFCLHDCLLALLPPHASLDAQFLGTVRAIQQNMDAYGIQCIFAVGPARIPFTEGKSGSPFNVREGVPVRFFSAEQVHALLQQFAAARAVVLEEGIGADVHELAAGHAGLVCCCGWALDTAVTREDSGHISLAAWRDYRARHIVSSAFMLSTVRIMVDSISAMSDDAKALLDFVLAAGDAPITLDDHRCTLAQYLAAEGWLLSVGDVSANTYRFTSPLARRLAMRHISEKRMHISDVLPLDKEDALIMPAAVETTLKYFSGSTMRAAAAASTTLSAAKVAGAPVGSPVPSEAAYHFQLFAALRRWMSSTDHADVYSEADSRALVPDAPRQPRKQCADVLFIGRKPGAPRHVLELVASANEADISEHYTRALQYMAAHSRARGTCITFTAVRSALDADAVDAESLTWPTLTQLDDGLEAIHVVHDLAWTQAAVHFTRDGRTFPKQLVALPAL